MATSMLKFSQPTVSGRVYPLSKIEKMVAKINDEIREGHVFITVDTPMDMSIHLDQVAAQMTECFIEDGHVMIEYKMLNTVQGKVISSLFAAQATLDVKASMIGSVNDDNVVSDLEFNQAYFSAPVSKPLGMG